VETTKVLFDSVTPRYPEFKGQVAVITGSGRGIGRGIAIRLAREGMKVVINSRTVEAVDRLTKELQDLGAEALGVPADIGASEGINKIFEAASYGFGRVDLLVNNAAELERRHFFDCRA
jgi:NAD(P)-dependent dehydrogenase (short-subunit alcohol dehydrogenase family)